MYVSGYIHPKWFESEGDRDLYFLKQVGIDHIDISLDLIDGYEQMREPHDRRGPPTPISGEEALAIPATAPAQEPSYRPEVVEHVARVCRVYATCAVSGFPVRARPPAYPAGAQTPWRHGGPLRPPPGPRQGRGHGGLPATAGQRADPRIRRQRQRAPANPAGWFRERDQQLTRLPERVRPPTTSAAPARRPWGRACRPTVCSRASPPSACQATKRQLLAEKEDGMPRRSSMLAPWAGAILTHVGASCDHPRWPARQSTRRSRLRKPGPGSCV